MECFAEAKGVNLGVEIFNVMRSAQIFLRHYETVVGQTRARNAAAVYFDPT